jgi:hypothetical protein
MARKLFITFLLVVIPGMSWASEYLDMTDKDNELLMKFVYACAFHAKRIISKDFKNTPTVLPPKPGDLKNTKRHHYSNGDISADFESTQGVGRITEFSKFGTATIVNNLQMKANSMLISKEDLEKSHFLSRLGLNPEEKASEIFVYCWGIKIHFYFDGNMLEGVKIFFVEWVI